MNRVCVVFLSLLLLAAGIQGIVTSLRNNCMCRTMSSKPLPVRLLMNFERFPRSPSCDHKEYIVTLKPLGEQQCLDPNSQAIQEMFKKYEKFRALRRPHRGSSRGKRSR